MTKPDVNKRRGRISATEILNMSIVDCAKIECQVADDLERFAR